MPPHETRIDPDDLHLAGHCETEALIERDIAIHVGLEERR